MAIKFEDLEKDELVKMLEKAKSLVGDIDTCCPDTSVLWDLRDLLTGTETPEEDRGGY